MSQGTPTIAPWKGPALVCAALAGAALLYWPGTFSLTELWSDTAGETYTSGFLIAAVSLWLLWQERAQLVPAPLPARRRLAALALLLGSALAWQFALRAGIQVVYLTLLPFLWWLCVALVCGRSAARATAFPLGFLIFAMPVWDYLIPLLQWLTVHVVRVALRVTGVPSYFSGEYVQIPAGIFQIQGGCSGLHYFIVGLAIAVLLGELRRDGWRSRLELILVGSALAILSNWIRVYSIILAGHLSHMQSYLVRVSHYSYGWFVFVATLILFFLYARQRAARAAPGQSRAEVPRDAGALPGYAWLGLVMAVAGLPAMLNLVISARLSHAGALPASQPTHLRDGWQVSAVDHSDWQPVQIGADAVRRWRFTRGAEVIEMFEAGYLEQRQRKKLGGRVNAPGGLDVAVLAKSRAVADGRTFDAQELEQADTRALLWRAFEVDGRWFAGEVGAQGWYSARTFLEWRSPPSRVSLLHTRCEPDCSAASHRLSRFVEQNGVVLWPASP